MTYKPICPRPGSVAKKAIRLLSGAHRIVLTPAAGTWSSIAALWPLRISMSAVSIRLVCAVDRATVNSTLVPFGAIANSPIARTATVSAGVSARATGACAAAVGVRATCAPTATPSAREIAIANTRRVFIEPPGMERMLACRPPCFTVSDVH